MTISSQLPVLRLPQIQHADNAVRCQLEHVQNCLGKGFLGNCAGAKCIHQNGNRMCHADRISQLYFAAFCQTGSHDILGDIPCSIRTRTVHLRRILTAECTAAVTSRAAVGVYDDLPSGQTAVTLRAADNKATGGVDEILGVFVQQFCRNHCRNLSRPLMKTHRKEHCSAIVATGSATVDGKPYLGHESFDEFWSGQYFNICKRVEPDDGYAFIMQASAPCMLSSMTDFYVTAAGLNITETTLAGFDRYDDAGMPEWVRIRDAVQYAATIDEFVERLNKGNNGGYANAWLIADHNTGEIARFEQGLEFTSLERTFDGAYFGCNAVFDPRIRNLECKDNGFNDPRQQTGARRQRWMELIDQYYGKIDLEVVKKMLADTYDVYLGYNCPSSRDICAHYDVDPQYYADDPDAVWNIPFYPAGSCDAKAAGPDDVRCFS